MKKLTYLLSLFAVMANSQEIQFDGFVFKNLLLASNSSNGVAKNQSGASILVDDNGDSEITVLEALDVYQIDVQNLSSIVNLIGIRNFANLEVLDCKGCSLSNLDISGLTNLNTLDVKNNNNLITLNVTGCTAMLTIDCRNDDLLSIDVSSLRNLVSIDVKNNNDLVSIYSKNGIDEDIQMDTSNTMLKYICADDSDTNTEQFPDCVIDSFCSIPPGGDYNTITGKMYFHNNIGPVLIQPNMKVKAVFSADASIQYTTTNAVGDYFFYTILQTGSVSVSPVLEAQDAATLFNGVVVVAQTIAGTNNVYPISTIQISEGSSPKHDYEVVVVPVVLPVSGQQAAFDIVYRNKGSKKVNSKVDFRFTESLCNLASCSIAFSPAGSPTGYNTLNFIDLLPFETRKFRVILDVLPSVVAGEVIEFDTRVYQPLFPLPDVIDPYLDDNQFLIKQTVVGADAPNRIVCLDGPSLAPTEIGKYLHYAINFQNNATQTATNVTLKTDFDPAKFNLESMQIMDTSHPLNLQAEVNPIATINPFEIYHLRAANIGGPGGQGGVLFKIKTKDDLTAGSTVGTGAEISFEYSPLVAPIVVTTTTAQTTFASLSATVFAEDASIVVYPNPANANVAIYSDTKIKTVDLFDIHGRLLQTNIKDADKATLDISQRATGTYFLKITSDKGQKVIQVVKE